MGPEGKENKGKAVLFREVLQEGLPKTKENLAVPTASETLSSVTCSGTPHPRENLTMDFTSVFEIKFRSLL